VIAFQSRNGNLNLLPPKVIFKSGSKTLAAFVFRWKCTLLKALNDLNLWLSMAQCLLPAPFIFVFFLLWFTRVT